MRRRRKPPGSTGVAMSPLIDCVFLLLIFFLVTTMLKRYERQIPVELADPTSAVALEPEGEAVLIGIDREGRVYENQGRNEFGVAQFVPTGVPLGQYLNTLGSIRREGLPIELVVEPGTAFQRVIDVLDVFEVQGFEKVRARVRSRPFQRTVPGGDEASLNRPGPEIKGAA